VRATEVLCAFQHPGESLRLRDVMARTRFGKGLCFRLLHTLHHCGFLERVEGNRYHLTVEIRRRRRYRIGYAAQGQDSSFPREVRAGLVRAAERENVELTPSPFLQVTGVFRLEYVKPLILRSTLLRLCVSPCETRLVATVRRRTRRAHLGRIRGTRSRGWA